MELHTCERCGQVEVAESGERGHAVEHGGETYLVCTRCYIELLDYFNDAKPDAATLVEQAI